MSWPTGSGSPLWGAPAPGALPTVSRGGNAALLTQPVLWRAQFFGVTLTTAAQPIMKDRMLVTAVELYANRENPEVALIGNRQVGDDSNYFELEPGRHAFIWTDNMDLEMFDIAQMWAAITALGATDSYLHVTCWQPTRL